MSRFFTSTLAQALHGFLTDFLPCQRNMSLHSLHSYRDSLKLLLKFVAGKRGDPSTLMFRCAKITEVGGWRVHGWVGAVRESSVNNLKRYQ